MVEEIFDAPSCTLSPASSSGTNSPAGSSVGSTTGSGLVLGSGPSLVASVSPSSGNRSTQSAPTTAATNTLPPCRVCGEKASGFHYGVNTCEACKGFFRRSLQRKDKYKCLGSGQCKIGIGRRSNCPSCRYLKCINVGMSKSAIKTGRYTHEKRTQDILEVKQMQLSRTLPTQPESTNIQVATTIQPASTSTPASPYAQIPESFKPDSFSALSPASDRRPPSVSTTSCPVSPKPFEPTTTMTPTPTPGTSSAPETTSTETQSSFSSQGEISSDDPAGRRVSRRYSHDDKVPSLMPLAMPIPMPLTPPEEPEDLDSIISMLVEAHKKFIVSHTFTQCDVLLERQMKYSEDFRRKEEMFGSLSTLPRDQYMEILEKTGMDVDNRQEMIGFFAAQMERGMKRYINFVKNIPGFSELPIDDQAALVKAARYEFWFCGSFPGFKTKLNVVCLPSGKNLHIKEMSKLWDQNFVLETFRLADTFQRLPLFPEEFVLVKCLCVTFADRCELKNQAKVEEIQWKITQCLLHLLRKNHSSSSAVFAKIIDRVTELRSLTEWNYKIARDLQIWPAIQQSPLMVEILSI